MSRGTRTAGGGSIVLREVASITPELRQLAMRARAEGFTFGDRLIDEWESGQNRFEQPGEVFFCVFDGDEAVGFGGLSRDPYSRRPEEGRVRHVYVDVARRERGVGRVLLTEIIERARPHFERLRLHTRRAGPFYERIGFEPVDEVRATHAMILAERVL